MAEKNYNAFEGLNLSDARSKNETREQYKERLKTNKKIPPFDIIARGRRREEERNL